MCSASLFALPAACFLADSLSVFPARTFSRSATSAADLSRSFLLARADVPRSRSSPAISAWWDASTPTFSSSWSVTLRWIPSLTAAAVILLRRLPAIPLPGTASSSSTKISLDSFGEPSPSFSLLLAFSPAACSWRCLLLDLPCVLVSLTPCPSDRPSWTAPIREEWSLASCSKPPSDSSAAASACSSCAFLRIRRSLPVSMAVSIASVSACLTDSGSALGREE